MNYTWHRVGRTYSFMDSPEIETEEVLGSTSYAYDTDQAYYFKTEQYGVPLGSGSWILWTEETESIDVNGNSLGVISSTQTKISKNGNIELWEKSEDGGPFVTTMTRDLTQVNETTTLGWNFYHINQSQQTGSPPPGSYRCYWEADSSNGQIHGRELVGTFEIRRIESVIIPTDCPVDPVDEPVELKAEVYALPAPGTSYVSQSGWTPDGDVDFLFAVPALSANTIPSSGPASFTPQAPDSAGKIGEVSIDWDGRLSDGNYLTIYQEMSIQPIANDNSLAGNVSRADLGLAKLFHRDCNCENQSGELVISFALTLMGGPIGTLVLIYRSFDSCKAPASLGYGWSSFDSPRLQEETGSEDLVYRNESGFTLRWEKDNGDYIPTRPDNYVLAESLGQPGPPFRLTFRNQTLMTFDSSGRLTSKSDRNGNTVTYTYQSGSLETISDDKGHLLTYDYGSRNDGQPVGIRAGDPVTGRLTQLDYDANDRLFRITDPDNQVTEFEYNQNGQLSKVIDVRPTRGDRIIEYTYDSFGRLLAENHFDVMLHRHNRWPEKSYVWIEESNTAMTPLDQGVPDFDNERLLYHLSSPTGQINFSALNYERILF